MRRVIPLLLAAGLVAATPVAAQDASRPAAYLAAEACMRDKVEAAVAASDGAADAASFLIDYLCVAPVAAASRYERNSASLARMRLLYNQALADPEAAGVEQLLANEGAAGTGDPDYDLAAIRGMCDHISVDPVTGEITNDGSDHPFIETAVQMGLTTDVYDSLPPVFILELAGQLVLEARTRR